MLGNAKGAVAVVVSILIFKNPVSSAGMVGYTITVLGVVFYSEAKKRSTMLKRKAAGPGRYCSPCHRVTFMFHFYQRSSSPEALTWFIMSTDQPSLPFQSARL